MKTETRRMLEEIAGRELNFDGSLWELDGYHAEDARREGYDDGETELARKILEMESPEGDEADG